MSAEQTRAGQNVADFDTLIASDRAVFRGESEGMLNPGGTEKSHERSVRSLSKRLTSFFNFPVSSLEMANPAQTTTCTIDVDRGSSPDWSRSKNDCFDYAWVLSRGLDGNAIYVEHQFR